MSFETDYSSGKYHWFTIMACSERDHIWNLIPQLKSSLPKYSLGKEGEKENMAKRREQRTKKKTLVVVVVSLFFSYTSPISPSFWKIVFALKLENLSNLLYTIFILVEWIKRRERLFLLFEGTQILRDTIFRTFFLRKKDKWLFKRKQ